MGILKISIKSATSKLIFYSFIGLAAAVLLLIATVILFTPLMITHGLGAVTETMKSNPYSNWLFYVSVVWFGFIFLLSYELENRGAFKINSKQSSYEG